MHRSSSYILGILFTSLAASGCGDTPASVPSTAPSAEFRLATEPADALEVLDAKEQAKDGAAVIVVGRIGGGIMPWIEGRAAFLLVDTRIQASCEDGEECKMGCPGCSKEMLEASTMVKFLGEDGKVLPVDARTLLGVKEQETVVIEGIASRDLAGNVSITGKGIFIRR